MTNLKILFTVVATLAVFTFVANVIPQVQSAVPEEIVLSADMPPEELAAIGEDIYAGVGGCTACHGLGTRAPDIVGVAGTVCATRVAGQSCKDYLWESLVSPLSYIVEGFEPIMLDQSRILSQAELWTLVAFLEAQGGEITVNADDFAAALVGQAVFRCLRHETRRYHGKRASRFGLVPYTWSSVPFDYVEVSQLSPLAGRLSEVDKDRPPQPVWSPEGPILVQREETEWFPFRSPPNAELRYELEGNGQAVLSDGFIKLRNLDSAPVIWRNLRVVPPNLP